MLNPAPSDLRAPEEAPPALAPAATCVGHVHLKVGDLDRAVAFYREVLGLEVTVRYGDRTAFLSAGGYHHHLALNTWTSRGAGPPPPGHTGLFHVAFLFPDRRALAQALARVLRAGVAIVHHIDHGTSEAIYFEDPDGNGIEIYRDRPRSEWPQGPEGGLDFRDTPLDLRALLAEA